MEFRNHPDRGQGSLTKGIFIALLPPLLGILGLLIKYPGLVSDQTILTTTEVKTLYFQVMSLGLIFNVLLFFLKINRGKEQTAKGILMATMFILMVGVINKFLL